MRTWKRDIKLWRKRARFHLPPNELAIDLLQALKGRARREVEHVDPDDFDVEDGIEKLIAVFEKSCKEQMVVRQSVAMKKYEELSRGHGQSITKYLSDWRDVESHLKHAGINTYPDEVRAARLLEGAKISEYARQLVMNSAGNAYDPDKIAQALELHFPAWMPGRTVKRGVVPGSASSYGGPSGRGAKGKGRGRGGSWKTFLAGDVEAEGHAEEPAEESREAGDLPDPDALASAADALTMTADKLKGITLGRGWSTDQQPKKKPQPKPKPKSGTKKTFNSNKPGAGNHKKVKKGGFKLKPGETFADLKKRTACSVCGRIGHWKGVAPTLLNMACC